MTYTSTRIGRPRGREGEELSLLKGDTSVCLARDWATVAAARPGDERTRASGGGGEGTADDDGAGCWVTINVVA
jgi:hypothetical protein